MVDPQSSTDTTSAWKKSCFILSERSDFYMIDDLSIAVHIIARCDITFSRWDIAVYVIVSADAVRFLPFLVWNHFLLLDLLKFEVNNLGRL